MSRIPIDLTDRELNIVYQGLFLLFNERNAYWSKGRIRVLNNLLKKLNESARERKDCESIMRSFYEFEEEDEL